MGQYTFTVTKINYREKTTENSQTMYLGPKEIGTECALTLRFLERELIHFSDVDLL